MFRKQLLVASLVAVVAGLSLSTMALADPPPGGSSSQPVWTTARISLIWPHDGQGRATEVARSRAVNVSVWPVQQVPCGQVPNFPRTLWRAQGNEPAEPVTVLPELGQRNVGGVRFPTLEFNGVPANVLADPAAKFRFFVPNVSNVWVHAADARTILPQPAVPTGYGDLRPQRVDTRIQIVWPHDEKGNPATADTATRVNIAVDVFEHGTLKSVPLDFPAADSPASPHLYVAEMNGPLSMTIADPKLGLEGTLFAVAQKATYRLSGQTYPRWVFNDVPVKPRTQYHFLVSVAGVDTYPTIWTHAQDARTILPNPQAPPSCQP